MKCLRKITVFWKVKTLFCVQKTADVSNFYCNQSVQVFWTWHFLLILQLFRRVCMITICKGNTDFQSRMLHQLHVFMNARIFRRVPKVLLPQENIGTVQFHTGIIISHLISKISNLELLSDREEFWFLLFSVSVFSIS